MILDDYDDVGLATFVDSSWFSPDRISDEDKSDYLLLYKDKDKELITKYWELFNSGIGYGGIGKPYSTYVYNIEVEDFHTYFVGEEGIWVHC